MIAFDIDGVLADTYSIIIDEIFKACGYDATKRENSTWRIEIPPGYPSFDLEKAIRQALYRVDEINPYKCAKIIIPEIYKILKEPIIFITARKEDVKKATCDWIEKHFSTIDYKVIFTSKKLEPLFENNIDIFVEDRLKTANFLSRFMKKMYLVNRNYNMGRFTDPRIIRIGDLTCLPEIIKKEKNMFC
jgi:uncharacterized HAD superfamily protein